MTETVLTPRWRPMKMHAERERLLSSPARHRLVAAGRRSGKTEDAKRIVIVGDANHPGALCPPDVPNPRFGIAAPTREQVKRIWWDDIKRMSPAWAIDAIHETELSIRYVTGSLLCLIGLDKPQRAEGDPYDGLVLDETQEVKPSAWLSSMRPTLSNRGRPPGWPLRIGRPKGRNHFWDWFQEGQDAKNPDTQSFTWKSAEVLSPEEIAAAKRDLDPRTYQQEYEATFLSATGLVYYAFDRDVHLRDVRYDASLPLVFCFDFNVAPGSAVVVQEQNGVTCVVGEVHIPDDSRTDLVCSRLCAAYPNHRSDVLIYGDPAGNQRRTSAQSNDWDIVKQHLRRTFPRVLDRVARSAPPIVDSVNSVNARLLNAAGECRFALNPQAAPQTLRDFEAVAWDTDKDTRDIDKDDQKRTHWTDALRYYIHERFPIGGSRMVST